MSSKETERERCLGKGWKRGRMLYCLTSFVTICLLTGCQPRYLNFYKDFVNVKSLASLFVKSPDPAKKEPPTGQSLFFSWSLPNKWKLKGPLILRCSILLYDHTEEVVEYPIDSLKGEQVYTLMGNAYQKSGGIFSYRATLLDGGGNILDREEHRLWVEKIALVP